MYGLEAISNHNGWAMAVVGISIVFSGLLVLSFAISQLHKFIDLWENRKAHLQNMKELLQTKVKEEKPDYNFSFSRDVEESVHLITKRMGEPFSLPRLIDISKKFGLATPHSTINELIKADLIIPDGKGYFYWNTKKTL